MSVWLAFLLTGLLSAVVAFGFVAAAEGHRKDLSLVDPRKYDRLAGVAWAVAALNLLALIWSGVFL